MTREREYSNKRFTHKKYSHLPKRQRIASCLGSCVKYSVLDILSRHIFIQFLTGQDPASSERDDVGAGKASTAYATGSGDLLSHIRK